MAFASVGTGGTTVNTSNNQSSSSHTVATNNLTAGRFGVLIIAVENNATTDGDVDAAVNTVTDSAGNTWSKAAEYCNGQGSAQAGSTVSVWYCLATANLNTGGTISWNFSSSGSRDESVSSLWIFSVDAGSKVALEGTNNPGTLSNDGADAGSLDYTSANIECLRVRAISAEFNSATQMTATSGSWTLFSNNRSANVANAQCAYGEFRILSGTSAASDPTLPTTGDIASVYVAFKEQVLQTLTPSLYDDGTDTFHSPTVSAGVVALTAPLYNDGTDTFYSSSIVTSQFLTASIVDDGTDTFFSPVVIQAQFLVASIFDDGTDTFYSPAASAGAVGLSPSLYDESTDAFYNVDVSISGGAEELLPPLLEDDDLFFSPLIRVPDAGYGNIIIALAENRSVTVAAEDRSIIAVE